ncbi:beta-ketoacyl synthase chain length factor [Achromobacter agilis]|uniref:beta-ketoacyl synthase chain length factor n=1 Tax=Achromobacter agilis TaxID=1353888 RepID=UPI001FC9BD4A|nr:beta-ketoacyl synthase chain length factor [Achromobacter agilis]
MPTLDFLPPLQRRRLSALARGVFACAWPMAEERPGMPLVYASRHGETSRNFGLLQSLAADEPLSPTAFGLSVHNAIAAQWSIIRRETAESVALSVEDDGLEHAIVEASMLLAQGHEDVLVVLAEELPPVPYSPWTPDVPCSYAVALRLRAGTGWTLAMDAPQAAPAADESQIWPNPLNLLRHLLLRTHAWRHANPARQWTWTRMA